MPKQTFLNLTAQKQRNIVYAALTEFTDKGYVLSNIGTIAKNAKVAKGSMYQYFEDKKEFYLYLMDYAFSMVKTTLRMQLEESMQHFESMNTLIDQWNSILYSSIMNYQAEVCFSIASLREQDVDIKERVNVWQKEYRRNLIEPQIKKLIEHDQISKDIDIEFCSLYCQTVSMISKDQLMDSLLVDSDSNQLIIQMDKDKWREIFIKTAQVLMNGLVIKK